jgi:thiol-disulfide isomerase/thioredoxin
MRRWFVIAGSAVVLVVLAIGIAQTSGGGSGHSVSVLAPAQANAKLAGATPRLAAIHAQSNEILGGGKSAYNKRVESLHGLPLVVNVWGSWCGPCRGEMPLFNRASANLGKRVAFLGVDTDKDPPAAAKKFLKKIPVYYPSYGDDDSAIAQSFGLEGVPSTVFYDRSGKQFVHQGPYTHEADLVTDINRYALTG